MHIYKSIFKYLVFFITFFSLIAQDNNQQLIGTWFFESMTTITKSPREEITIVYKDKKNLETLSFRDSNLIKYNVMNDGIKKEGNGFWSSDDNFIKIIVDKDTTFGSFTIKNKELSIITSETESDSFYASSTILKYKIN